MANTTVSLALVCVCILLSLFIFIYSSHTPTCVGAHFSPWRMYVSHLNKRLMVNHRRRIVRVYDRLSSLFFFFFSLAVFSIFSRRICRALSLSISCTCVSLYSVSHVIWNCVITAGIGDRQAVRRCCFVCVCWMHISSLALLALSQHRLTSHSRQVVFDGSSDWEIPRD